MHSSKNSLLLMELILSILFFALTAAVCLQLFVKAHLLSQDTINLNHAVTESQNFAEVFLAGDGSLRRFPDYFIDQLTPDSCSYDDSGMLCSFTLFYDKDWNPSGLSDHTYQITIAYTQKDQPAMRDAIITVSDTEDFYRIPLQKYISREVSYEP